MRNKREVLASAPQLLLDNGAELYSLLDSTSSDAPCGGTEETTTGGERLRAALNLEIPVIVINDSPLKAIVENQHGVGQSAMESFLRITNLMPQGKRFLVIGYGWCGRGIAHYARGLGASVVVAEVDEIKALEAAMDGFAVVELPTAAQDVSVVITATGRPNVFTAEAIDRLADGAILANAGHFDREIDVDYLRAIAVQREDLDAGIESYSFEDGRRIVLLTGGRMFNLGGRAPKGNSIESMDLGFSLQALCLERIATHPTGLCPGPQPVPDDINRHLAAAMVRRLSG